VSDFVGLQGHVEVITRSNPLILSFLLRPDSFSGVQSSNLHTATNTIVSSQDKVHLVAVDAAAAAAGGGGGGGGGGVVVVVGVVVVIVVAVAVAAVYAYSWTTVHFGIYIRGPAPAT